MQLRNWPYPLLGRLGPSAAVDMYALTGLKFGGANALASPGAMVGGLTGSRLSPLETINHQNQLQHHPMSAMTHHPHHHNHHHHSQSQFQHQFHQNHHQQQQQEQQQSSQMSSPPPPSENGSSSSAESWSSNTSLKSSSNFSHGSSPLKEGASAKPAQKLQKGALEEGVISVAVASNHEDHQSGRWTA